MFENHECNLCQLASTHPATVCLQGKGNTDSAKMAVFMDYPPFDDDIRRKPYEGPYGKLVIYMLERMGINVQQDVVLDYVLKCYAKKAKMPSHKRDRLACIEACSTYRFATLQSMPNLKSIVGMGSICLEAFNGSSEIGKFEGECWSPHEPFIRDIGMHHIWFTYSPAYIIEKPGEAPGMYRILWTAAEEAGLEPKETKIPAFEWPEKQRNL